MVLFIRVRQYIKRLKLQPIEEYCVSYRSTSQTYSQNGRKFVWRFGLPRYSTLGHTKYIIWTLKLNWKEMTKYFSLVFLLCNNDPFWHFRRMYFPSYTVLLNTVWVGVEFVRKGRVVYIRRLRGSLGIQSCGII